MTPRERVWKAVNHRTPDRVPIDLGSMTASGIASIAYDKMKRRLGISTRTKLSNPCSMLAVVEDEVLRRLHVDVVPLDLPIILGMVRPDREWVPRRLFDGTDVLFPPGTSIAEQADGGWILLNADGSPSTFRMPKNGFYFDDMSFNKTGRIDTQNFRVISDIPDEHLSILGQYGRSLYQNTDYAILGWGFGVSFLGMSWVSERATNLKPHYKKLCDWIHANTPWKTFLHSCGSVKNLLPHFIEAGIDILNPVQTSAANMDPAQLKKEFGDRLVFWGGGCDTQQILGRAAPDEIRRHVKQRIEIFAPGGGYVFNQVHNIQANVPPENIIAMFDAAYEFGGYGDGAGQA